MPVRLPADAELPLLRTRVSDLADRALDIGPRADLSFVSAA